MENVGATTHLTQSRWKRGNTQGNRKKEIQRNIQDNKAEEKVYTTSGEGTGGLGEV